MSKYEFDEHPAAIADTETESDVVNVGQKKIVGFLFPASFDGATITLKASLPSADTYVAVNDPDTGSAISINAGADAYVPVQPSKFAGVKKFKIVSASAMTADRTVTVITSAID